MASDSRVLCTALGLAATLLVATPVAQAFNFGDIMNPSRWLGGGRDDYYDDYYGGPWGPGYGGYGWPGYGWPGYGGYGWPGYGGYGWPGVGYGYGLPGYGYGAPGYVAPAAPAAPAASSNAKDKEIEALKRRIDQLESRQSTPPAQSRPAAPAGGEGWPTAPAFRPMDQY